MKTSNLLLATQRENPSDAETISHKLMLKAGLIRQVASGVYNWLPLGVKVLRKVENIVRREMENSGAQEILMPMVQPGELWKESGRWQQYGQELLIFEDRHDREFCLGPTHEEVITDLCRNEIRSYKQLPVIFYQIQTKFRDEIRPRFGVMRSREFIMKDAYSFDLSEQQMDDSYQSMRDAYIKIFNSLGLDYRIVKADSGAIGGADSEEFHVLADSGEDLLAFSDKSDYAINAELLIESKSDQDPGSLEGQDSPDGKGKLKLKRGIEVGHIFKLGRKYSESMKLTIQSEKGNIHPEMGCYGIGISRIVAAAIEQSHDDKGIIWSKEISPYTTALVEINPKGEENLKNLCTQIYTSLKERGHEVLWDDRDQSAGVKFSDMELIGIPQMIIIGEKSFRENKVEFKIRGEDKIVSLTPDEVLNKIQ
ncbi:MAG: proline--tRNA ligase [SAR86 cluster bacterium]|jgi:prolyl-tRNA synthetase|tara:strand:- start:3898 stop:5169 length:1272 start_codon:yes stop_codon:yes gene_type:complete